MAQPDRASRLLGRGRRGRRVRISSSISVNDDLALRAALRHRRREWRDYRVEVLCASRSHCSKEAGLAFRYRTSRHYYRLALEDGTRLRLASGCRSTRSSASARGASWRARRSRTTRRPTTGSRPAAEGDRLRGFVDGKPLIDVRDGELAAGIAGITANMPARFQAFRVTATAAAAADVRRRIDARERELEKLRADNPQPKLWRKFDTPGFGAGRNVRFGDLDGDGGSTCCSRRTVPKVRGDAFDHISCLTAVTLDGKVLWQQGRPNPRNGLLTNDTPFQIHDLDGDGSAEVVLVRDFQLQVLEGRTGRILRTRLAAPHVAGAQGPPVRVEHRRLAAVRQSRAAPGRRRDPPQGSLRHVLGLRQRSETALGRARADRPLSVPDRHRRRRPRGVHDRLSPVGADGKPALDPRHRAEGSRRRMSIGNFTAAGRRGAMRAYSMERRRVSHLRSERTASLKHLRLGHAQTQSVGSYRADLPGLQIVIANFWRNPGIVTLLDADGNILAQDELIPGSSHLPVNWRGDGQEFALLSGNIREGGMIDGQLRRVVMFPDDGHPDLASAVRDLTGDPRDEIMLWDQRRVWIYTQDRRSPASASTPRAQPALQRLELSRLGVAAGWAPRRTPPGSGAR